MKRIWIPTLTYALAHFAVDFGCAWAMFSTCRSSPAAFLVYNFFAFAMQMPLGLLADELGRNRLFALLGVGLVALINCLPSFGIPGALVLGLGNGLFHIGGGLDVMHRAQHQAAPLGVFVSPGAFGIYFGTLLSAEAKTALPVFAALGLSALAVTAFCHREQAAPAPLALPNRSAVLPGLLLFLVVILRSYGGMAASFSWKTGLWSLAAVTAVVLGKTLGGFLSDWIGLRRAAAWSLGLCCLLFCLGEQPLCGTLALLLFNMTMPMTLFSLSQVMPGCKGFSFGLLTFALFLGYLPSFFGADPISCLGMALVAAISAALLLLGISRRAVP